MALMPRSHHSAAYLPHSAQHSRTVANIPGSPWRSGSVPVTWHPSATAGVAVVRGAVSATLLPAPIGR